MSEQERFYKMLREMVEAVFVGFGIGVIIVLALVAWVFFAP